MRVDSIWLKNFRGYEDTEFSFVPGVNLLIGPNASGKTTVLEALSVALGGFFLGISGADARSIRRDDARLQAFHGGEVPNFEPQYPVEIQAAGELFGKSIRWSRALSGPENRTTSKDAQEIKALALRADDEIRSGAYQGLPLLRYYGNGRLWLEPKDMDKEARLESKGLASRVMGYYLALDPRCSPRDLMKWLQRQEWIQFKERKPARTLEMIRSAIVRCIEGARDIGYDPKRLEMVVSFNNGRELPFSALSDGQRGIAALVGDLGMRAAQLNPQLEDSALEETAGVVLIDEVDLYLHPKWQRTILKNLSTVFPKVQFICTTHSPQVIGEVEPERIINLGGPKVGQAIGLDSNSILRGPMGATDRDDEALALIDGAYSQIAKDDLSGARVTLMKVRAIVRGSDLETTRLETMIGNLEAIDAEESP